MLKPFMSTSQRIAKVSLNPHDICIAMFWRLSNALFDFCKADLGDNEPLDCTRDYAFLLAQSTYLQITDNSENEYMFGSAYRRVSEFRTNTFK
jgi:hypothetical protein